MRAGTGSALPNIPATQKNDKFQVNALRGLSEVSRNLMIYRRAGCPLSCDGWSS
jgi:hypothetical protein